MCVLIGEIDDCIRESSLIARLNGDFDDLVTHGIEEGVVTQDFANDMGCQQTKDAVVSISIVLWDAVRVQPLDVNFEAVWVELFQCG